MRTFLRSLGFCCLAVLAGAALAACPPGGHGIVLSGAVIDGASGAALTGAKVCFSTHEAVVGGDGSFSLSLDKGETGIFAVDQAGYLGILLAGVSCDANASVVVKMSSLSGGSTHSFGGKIYEFQTNPAAPTEIASASYDTFARNAAGGASRSGPTNSSFSSYNPAATPSYSGTTTAYGTDCIVVVEVQPAGMNPFRVVQRNVDLSASITPLDLGQDAAHTSTVTVTADHTNNGGDLLLDSPYGILPAASLGFSSSAAASVDVTNPYGYQIIASQKEEIPNSPVAGYARSLQSTSNPMAPSASVALPAIDHTLGPTAATDPASLSYAAGTLSVGAVAGAGMYLFQLTDNGSGSPVAMVLSDSPSFALPSWLATRLQGRSIRVTVMAGDSNMAWDVGTVAAMMGGDGPYTPGIKLALMASMSGADYKDLTF